jgi:serine/threonine protein kinase
MDKAVNLPLLRDKIKTYVREYYSLETRPILQPQDQWLKDIISPIIEYTIIDLELKDMSRIQVTEPLLDLKVDKVMNQCMSQRNYKIVRKLENNVYLLSNNKVASFYYVGLWQYREKHEMHKSLQSLQNIYHKASKLRITPRFHDLFFCFNGEKVFQVIVTDYIKGISLDAWLNQNHSPSERKHLYNILKRKIDRMHANGIIHNAVYNSNVIIRQGKLDAFLTSFETAYDLNDKTMYSYNKWMKADRNVLNSILQNAVTINNAEEIVLYVAHKLITNNDITR